MPCARTARGPLCAPSCAESRARREGAMAETEDEIDPAQDDRASPTSIASPVLRLEAKRAMVWVAVVGLTSLAIYISQALLVIFGGLVFASMLARGERLVGRVLPIGRGWRLGLVILLGVAFLVWLGYFAGSQISREAAELPQILTAQASRAIGWLDTKGFAIDQRDLQGMASQLLGGVGTVTRAIG